jgi:Archaeal Type IV pilin, N-terminal
VSEVVGTILILALTVTLFSSIFFFVSTFPKPAQQPSSQFEGQLYTSTITKGSHTWTNISSVTITHLGGPILYNFNTVFYVVSQAHPQNTTATYTMTSGGLGASPSTSWGTGQVWNLTLAPDHLTLPDNITVTVVSGSNVVYRQTLPGTNPTIPPIFDNEGTSPATPTAGSSFSIWAQISDPFLRITSKQVYVNVTTPGLTCSNPLSAYSTNMTTKLQMSYNASNGLWFLSGCSTTTSNTYYVTIWVTDTNPLQIQSNTIIFPLFVSSSGSTGPSCSNTYTFSLVANPTTTTDGKSVTLTLNITNGNACDWIYVSGAYTGSVTAGTYGAPATSSYTDITVPAGGSITETTTWTTPSATCGSGHSTCTGTGTITFTVSYASGATGPTTQSVTISY